MKEELEEKLPTQKEVRQQLKKDNRESVGVFLTIIAIAILISLGLMTWKGIIETAPPRTVLTIENTSETDSVLTYLTLGDNEQFITDVNGIFGITDTGLQGSFYLKKDSVYTYEYSGKGLSGNISFGTPPLNCPTKSFPTGNNLYEVTINNFGSVTDAQETIDISNVAGCNALGSFNMTNGGSWIANGDTITSFYNNPIYMNVGLYGVFPFKCDVCVASASPPVCSDTLKSSPPQVSHICNISRDAHKSGGVISLKFKGYTK